MNQSFYINNRAKFAQTMEENSVMLLLSGHTFRKTGDQDYPFSVDRSFLYMTGIDQADVKLLLCKTAEGVKEYLFLEENDPVRCKWIGMKLTKEEATALSGVESVSYLSEFDAIFQGLFENGASVLYLDFNGFAPKYPTVLGTFKKRFEEEHPDVAVKDANRDLIFLRMYKTAEEVEEIKKSIATTKGALESVMKSMRPGLYEYQIESYFDFYIKYNGQKTTSFDTICATGKNATVLHYTNNNSVIADGDLVQFDLGCETNHYISDISRAYPANGKFTARQKAVYEEVLNCNKRCAEFLKPGVTFKEYNEFANSILIEGMKKLGLIEKDEDFRKYYWHSVGHSIGLDTHDPSLREEIFKPGMIVSDEPGIYIEEEGIGIRIEDDILITETGSENLSKEIIKEVADIEAFMA